VRTSVNETTLELPLDPPGLVTGSSSGSVYAGGSTTGGASTVTVNVAVFDESTYPFA
jgi:hypothetical protein